MTNWSFKKVQGDQINVNNYIVDVYFSTLTNYSNYLAYNKGNAEKKRLVFAGINSLFLLLKVYAAVRKAGSLQKQKEQFETIYDRIKKGKDIDDTQLHTAIEFIGDAMFLIGFTDINWEFKDYSKSL